MTTCDKAYPGTNHQRLLVQTPSYLLVFDTLDSNTERCFEWLYHNRGSDASCDTVTKPMKFSDPFPGSEYIANTRKGITDNIIRIQFKDKGITTYLTMAAEPQTEVLVGDGPGASTADRVPLTMISRHGKKVRFAAVLEPVRDDQLATVTNVQIMDSDDTALIKVSQGDMTDTILVDGKDNVQVRRDDKVMLQPAQR